MNDWRERRLRPPPRGYRWVRDDVNNYYLMLIATGMISQALYHDSYDDLWRRRYSRLYTYEDDIYYRDCRQGPDPAGVIVGALIGGLLGNAVGYDDGRAGTTVAGVILGGALGAALTRDLDCEDRSYAYRAYYDGFNAGQEHALYQWRNPSSGHYGDFRVEDYYYDPDGFRCANYSQRIYIGGMPETATGHACEQPDGTWAIVG